MTTPQKPNKAQNASKFARQKSKLNGQQQRIEAVKQRLTNIRFEEIYNIKILEGLYDNLQPCLFIWYGRQSKPYIKYCYKNADERAKSKQYYLDRAKSDFNYKQQRKSVPTFEIGDIYVASWGYEQTNVDYYQVINKPSKHFALLQEIAAAEVPGSRGIDCCNVLPVKDKFLSSKPIRRKVTNTGITIDRVRVATKFDGKPDYCSWYH